MRGNYLAQKMASYYIDIYWGGTTGMRQYLYWSGFIYKWESACVNQESAEQFMSDQQLTYNHSNIQIRISHTYLEKSCNMLAKMQRHSDKNKLAKSTNNSCLHEVQYLINFKTFSCFWSWVISDMDTGCI